MCYEFFLLCLFIFCYVGMVCMICMICYICVYVFQCFDACVGFVKFDDESRKRQMYQLCLGSKPAMLRLHGRKLSDVEITWQRSLRC